MEPFRVVVVLDVLADRVVRFGARFKSAAVHQFFLEGRKEALGDGVVVAVAGGAHAAARAVPVEQASVLMACVLGASIGVMDQAWRWLAARHGMLEPPPQVRGSMTCASPSQRLAASTGPEARPDRTNPQRS